MGDLTERLLLPENLMWAWRKAKRLYRMADSFVDMAALAEFELNLESELSSIADDFANGTYELKPIRPIVQPKRSTADGVPRFRQYFQVSVRDQVAWIALANVLGPILDNKMPSWSYGNRLYRPAWYEKVSPEESQLSIGPYRHAPGHLYRKFKHSWPVYRRHISLIARAMASKQEVDPADVSDGERRTINEARALPYWDSAYWRVRKNKNGLLYFATIDLSKFFPTIRSRAIYKGFRDFCDDLPQDRKLCALIKEMLNFKVDLRGIPKEMLDTVQPEITENFPWLPTGLLVGGFLANVAMIRVDNEVQAALRKVGDVAHFRFVDDHTIISFKFDRLKTWIEEYEQILKKHLPTVKVEHEKTEPVEFRDYLADKQTEEAAKRACEIDGRRPIKLMSTTLAQVSAMARADFETLAEQAREHRVEQLRWLLLTDLPEREIRGDTRVSFAASRISTLGPALYFPDPKLIDLDREMAASQIQLSSARKRKDREALKAIRVSIRAKKPQHSELLRLHEEGWRRHAKSYFTLLLQAFIEYPDKVRLFLRLFDYCRSTGHAGLDDVLTWLEENRTGRLNDLARYYAGLSLQVVANQIATAAKTLLQDDETHRARVAAREFINDLHGSDFFTRASDGLRGGRYYEIAAKNYFISVVQIAAGILGASEKTEIEAGNLRRIVRRAGSTLRQSSETWKRKTGSSLSVWLQAFLDRTAEVVWDNAEAVIQILQNLEVTEPNDRMLLRTFPEYVAKLPKRDQGIFIAALQTDDGGILAEVIQHADSEIRPLIRRYSRRGDFSALAAQKNESDYISLIKWTEFAAGLNPYDPRRSEWTSLEILRKILHEVSRLQVDGTLIDVLELHPGTINVPRKWMADRPSVTETMKWTWEVWRAELRQPFPLRLKPGVISDYRFSGADTGAYSKWPRDRRVLGLLLWGLLNRGFALPRAWNLPGQERSYLSMVGNNLDRLGISSATIAILQGCLTAAANETSFMKKWPKLWALPDSDLDLESEPSFDNLQDLEKAVSKSQRSLENLQISVLEHQPRQLIPVDIITLRTSEFAVGADDEELADDRG